MTENYPDLMNRFRKAYATADPSLLGAVLTPDFEWHNHFYLDQNDQPTGRVLRGLDEMVEELQYRKKHWSDVKFEGLLERFAPGLVTQTFTISGQDAAKDRSFHVAAVDLYTVTDDTLIAKKDTYWKYKDA